MNEESGPWKYFLVAFLLFTLLGCDLLSLFAGRLVDGRPLLGSGVWSTHWYATVVTFLCSCTMWCIGIVLVFRWLREQPGSSGRLRIGWDLRAGILLILTIILIFVDAFFIGSLRDGTFPEIARAYVGFGRKYGNHAAIVLTFQYIYYFFESLMVLLMVVCFQRAGKLWSGKTGVPWASLGLVCTWGVIHFLSHPSGALGVTVWSSLPGVFYLLGRKTLIPVFSILLLAFFL